MPAFHYIINTKYPIFEFAPVGSATLVALRQLIYEKGFNQVYRIQVEDAKLHIYTKEPQYTASIKVYEMMEVLKPALNEFLWNTYDKYLKQWFPKKEIVFKDSWEAEELEKDGL